MKLLPAALVLALALLGCGGGGSVVRVVDGREVEGRYIDAEAYDAFLRGTISEEDGDLEVAAAWYARAFEFDAAGVEILARLGWVLCAQGPAHAEEARKVLDRAAEIDPGYGGTRVSRVRCAMKAGDARTAETEAREAMTLDPDDPEATRALSEALALAGRLEDAARVLDAWVAWSNGSRKAWESVAQLASKRNDHARAQAAREHLQDGAPQHGHLAFAPDRARLLSRIDQAIVRGDLALARSVSLEARMSSSSVAVRACALGRWREATEQAELLLAADPGDTDAMAVLLASPYPAFRGSGRPRWDDLLAGRDAARPLTPLAALVVADAVRRRAGDEAAKAFLQEHGEVDGDAEDPLIAALVRRLSSQPVVR